VSSDSQYSFTISGHVSLDRTLLLQPGGLARASLAIAQRFAKARDVKAEEDRRRGSHYHVAQHEFCACPVEPEPGSDLGKPSE